MQSITDPFRELTRKRDFYAGGLMLLIGLGVALKGWSSYRLGTLMHMGPGFLPTALGAILALIGIAIAGAAASAGGRRKRPTSASCPNIRNGGAGSAFWAGRRSLFSSAATLD